MSETATPSAPAGATTVESIKTSLSVPVPASAPPPTTDAPAPPQAAAEPAKAAEPEKQEVKDEQPRDDDGKFKPKSTAEDRKARIQSDIDRLTAEKRDAEREVARMRTEALRLQQQLRETPVDEFDTAGQTRKAVREDRFEQTVEAAQRAAQVAIDAQSAVFMAKVQDARERIPDLDTALNSFAQLKLSDAACDLIAESDRAADIANYLGKNPLEAQKLLALPIHRQGAEIARIEAKVSTAPQARRSSNAPPPPPMINGSSSPSSKTPAEMSVEELGRLIFTRA